MAIQSRIINGRRVQIGSKAEKKYLAQGFVPETEGATSRMGDRLRTDLRILPSQRTPINTTVDASRLGSVTPTPISTPELNPTTDNLGMANNSFAAQIKTDSTLPVNPEKAEIKKGLAGYIQNLANRGSEIEALQKEAKIEEKRKKASSIANELDVLDKNFREEAKEIKHSSGGLTSGTQAKLSIAQEKYENRRANIGLSYRIANEDLQGAEQILNEKVNAIKAQGAALLEAYQIQSSLINDDLTESEKMQVQNNYDLLKTKQEAVTTAYSDALKEAALNGAPPSVLSAIDDAARKPNATEADIYAAAGSYYGALERQQQNRLSGGGSSSNAPGTNPDSVYENDLDAMIGTILSTIPTKFGQQTFSTQIANARNDADKINLVAAQVLKGQPAEFKNDFRNQAVGVSQLDKAIALLDQGVQSGVLQNAAQYTYNLIGQDFDPKLAQIQGYITSAIQPYRNSVTGAAWGEQEDAEYNSLFGSTKYSPEELRQRLVQTKELLKSKSAEGLNAIANPLGAYENPFNTGNLTPDPIVIPTANGSTIPASQPVQSFWGNTWNWLFGSN